MRKLKRIKKEFNLPCALIEHSCKISKNKFSKDRITAQIRPQTKGSQTKRVDPNLLNKILVKLNVPDRFKEFVLNNYSDNKRLIEIAFGYDLDKNATRIYSGHICGKKGSYNYQGYSLDYYNSKYNYRHYLIKEGFRKNAKLYLNQVFSEEFTNKFLDNCNIKNFKGTFLLKYSDNRSKPDSIHIKTKKIKIFKIKDIIIKLAKSINHTKMNKLEKWIHHNQNLHLKWIGLTREKDDTSIAFYIAE